ncbi:MAG: MFS transporter, partial [Anaerolineae bacterium]|nr:MFS transporter [Anaerolineae bacterium]
MPTKHNDAFRVYMIFSFLWRFSLTLAFTVNMVYLVTVMHLDPLQMVLVGTALELSAFLFEVPTGVVADVYSRRLSVIVGMALMGLSFFVFVVPSFLVILLSQVILGIGWTFISGAISAWLVDEIGEETAGQAFIRA